MTPLDPDDAYNIAVHARESEGWGAAARAREAMDRAVLGPPRAAPTA